MAKSLSIGKQTGRWFGLAFLTKCINTETYVHIFVNMEVFNLHRVHKKRVPFIYLWLNHGICSPYLPSVFY